MAVLIKNKSNTDRIILGVSHGDINGISYEVLLKTFADLRLLDLFTPVIYGHSKVASYYKKNLNYNDIQFNLIKDADQAHPKRINIINCTENDLKIDVGQSTSIAGEAAFEALEMAMSDFKKGKIHALVTLPINKQNIQSDVFSFPGHTEYLSTHFDKQEPLMLMVWNYLRVGTLTGHIPLKEVPGKITEGLINTKIKLLNESLIRDFGIAKPKIAVLGLNPHAGDGGLLGSEEKTVIMPALEKLRQNRILVFGPFPADGFFGSGAWKKYDGVMGMYHDQALAPFKSIAFEGGVNFTAGLPIVRTSPAHGTAFEIAGQNIASEDSFREALYLALDVFRNRAEFAENTADPLPSFQNNKT
ncbi:MAG: 4-hydroxythreonine-4-phosphate dehydrogenase PdxA [Bacteroidales bacterium]|jgi:4-hydroxythreonine-4-phosphate dehydrogenase|nr:4-hydroxythreonine-4-phosphate dehydrogenase PdxA [Bacteroidales bacterium]